MSGTTNPCTCNPCIGAACTCGCQTAKTDRRAGCRCGDSCGCGASCRCATV